MLDHSFTKYLHQKDDKQRDSSRWHGYFEANMPLPRIEAYIDAFYVSADGMEKDKKCVFLHGGDICTLNSVIAVKTLYVSLGTFNPQHVKEHNQYQVSGLLCCLRPEKYIIMFKWNLYSTRLHRAIDMKPIQEKMHLPKVKEECDVRDLLLSGTTPLLTLARMCKTKHMRMLVVTIMAMRNELKKGNFSSKQCAFLKMSDDLALAFAICVSSKLDTLNKLASIIMILSLIDNTLYNNISTLLDMCEDDDDRSLLLLYITHKSPTLMPMGIIFDNFRDVKYGLSTLIENIYTVSRE